MTATGKVLFDVQLSAKEQKAIERITGGKVLKDAKLEVQVQVEVKANGNDAQPG